MPRTHDRSVNRVLGSPDYYDQEQEGNTRLFNQARRIP